MITATLSLAVLLIQQSPVESKLRGVHESLEAGAVVEQVEEHLAAVKEGSFDSLRTPGFVRALRADGLAAADLTALALEPGNDAEELGAAFRILRLLSGLDAGEVEVAEDLSIEDFIKLCDYAYRDLRRPLGTGRRLIEITPALHSAIGTVTNSIDNLAELSDEDLALLKERMERLGQIDQQAIFDLAEGIARGAEALHREDLIEAASKRKLRKPRSDQVVTGEVLIDRGAGFGRVVVGGPGRNTYDCSQLGLIIDIGGDDEYRGLIASAGELRVFSVVVDLGGDDVYDTDNDGLGSASFGIGLLFDAEGDDRYRARDRSAGYGSGGFGALIDLAGADRYELGASSAGAGFGGIGLLLDLDGNDHVSSGAMSCGAGLPGGVGLYYDGGGDDLREVEGREVLLGVHNQLASMALGVGVGVMPEMSGGIGAFLDLGGSDRYLAEALSCGVGLRGGVGLFRDMLGADHYAVGDVALGAGYGSGIGVCLDDDGDDEYLARRMAMGAGQDGGFGFFVDRSGDDLHRATAPSFGSAIRGATSGCVDLGGVDQWTQIGGPEDWMVQGVAAVWLDALGVFLDEGGDVDVYEFSRAPPPDNDRVRVIPLGSEDSKGRQVFVDR